VRRSGCEGGCMRFKMMITEINLPSRGITVRDFKAAATDARLVQTSLHRINIVESR
jgi:hypothetical protein